MGVVRAAWLALVPVILFAQQQAPQEMQRAVEEFRALTQNMGLRADSPRRRAENGRKLPQWHGRLFENFRNNWLDAVPHEVVQRGGRQGMLRRSQFGFNVTGPVEIPWLYHGGRRTFFSFSYEGMRERVGRGNLRTIPTMAERTGDWSAVVDQAGLLLPIFDPASTSRNPNFDPGRAVSVENLEYNRAAFPGNRIPSSRLDGTAKRALEYYPAPNSDAGPFFRNNYFIFAPEVNRADGVIVRVDHNVGERHRLGFGLNSSNGVDGAAEWFPSIANPGPLSRDRRSRRGGMEHVFTRTPRTINTLTFEASTDQTANQPRLDERGNPFPNYRFVPYLSMGNSYPVSRNARNGFAVTNGFSARWREHRFRVVLQAARDQVHSFWPQYPEGSFRFSAGLTSLPGIVNTGHGFASFLLGSADYAEKSVVISPSYFRRTRGLVALRDQWELRRDLTLNIGFNIDVSTPRVEKHDRQSTVALDEVNPVNGRMGALVAAGNGRFGRAFQPTQVRPEPSMSLAWNVRGNTRTVARVSYSRSYSPIPIYSGQWGTQAFNGTLAWISMNQQLTPAVTLAQGLEAQRQFPDLRPEAANNTIADLVDSSGKQPTYQSASAQLEKELPGALVLTMGLAHSEGVNLLVGNSASNPNAIPLSALEFRDQLNDETFNRSLRPFPHYQRFDVYSSFPEGSYQRDACYARLEKRTSAGLSLTASYEYSKQMDNYSGPYGIQDYYNRDNEWSLTSSNNPHRFSMTYVYELPLGTNKALLQMNDWRRYLVDGWSLSGVTTMSSGEPVALRPQFNNTGGVVDSLRVNVVPGVDPRVSNQGPELWFNPAAFAHPGDFTTGDAGRTHPTLRQPGNQNHDVSVTKRFSVRADRTVEFSAAGFNFLNQANWTEPDMVIGTAAAPNVNAGRIIGSRGGRVIQLGLRVSF
ncbi:MAG: hypothetical protein FJW20_17270 [Acidimicrobiia bacterium]|nr:hypothetical protein [Acidimicrobiia bacterium]